jgi:hypothetical protein
MSGSHTETNPLTPEAPATIEVVVDSRSNALTLKSRIARRARMRCSNLTDVAVAVATHTSKTTVLRWRDKEREDAPSLRHMLCAPDELVDAWLSELAVEREKLGFGTRRWTATADENAVDLAPELEAAVAAAQASAAEVTRVVAKMRGNRR